MSNSLYGDIMDALHEVEDFQKGSIQLKTDIIEIPDAEIISRFSLLSDADKYFISGMIDRLLTTNTL